MANVKITNLPNASSADAVDSTVFPIVSGNDNATKQMSLDTLRSTFFCNTLCVSTTLTDVEVQALSGSPEVLVPAAGVGSVIEVIAAFVKLDFNSAAYTGGTTLRLITNGANQAQATCTALNSTVSTIKKFGINSPTAATDTQLIENASLELDTVAVANTGDSPIEVFVLYRVINV